MTRHKLRLRDILIIFAVTVCLFAPQSAQAATGRLYITPAKNTVDTDTLVTMAIRIDPQTDINGVGFELRYDASKLRLSGFDDTDSSFPYYLETDAKDGFVRVIKATDGSTINTDALVTRAQFSVIGASGNATITMDGNAANYDVYTNPVVFGAAITIKPSAAPAADKPSPDAPTSTPTPTPTVPTADKPADTPTSPQPADNSPTDQPDEPITGKNIVADSSLARANPADVSKMNNIIAGICGLLVVAILIAHRVALARQAAIDPNTRIFGSDIEATQPATSITQPSSPSGEPGNTIDPTIDAKS